MKLAGGLRLGGSKLMMRGVLTISLTLAWALVAQEGPKATRTTINTSFEGGSLGKVEGVGDTQLRCHVAGQHDEHGRNRQANWYFFRLDGVAGKELTIVLTDFVGEYNNRPGACPMNADTIPVFSYDGEQWQHFAAMDWDTVTKEAKLKFRPERDTVWLAHVPPYTPSRLEGLLREVNRHPQARVEVIGKTVQGRDLALVTLTETALPDTNKKVFWLVARQHAWETGTSFVAEGLLRFLTSDEPEARKLRDQALWRIVPMMDPDGCANGKVRFNANGYDLNRHWNEVDLRDKRFLQDMPEIWYVKKAIFAALKAGERVDLMLCLHNTETGEFIEAQADEPAAQRRVQRLFDRLVRVSSFDPSAPPGLARGPDSTLNSLWQEWRVPVALMEQRISSSKKLGRRPTTEDRLLFGRQLAEAMMAAVGE